MKTISWVSVFSWWLVARCDAGVSFIGENKNARSLTTTASSSLSSNFDALSVRGGGLRFAARTPPKIVSQTTTTKSSPPPPSTTKPKTSGEYKTGSLSETKDAMDSFLTRDSRTTFIARVYSILAGQMAVTALSVFAFGTNDWAAQLLHTPGQWGAAVPGVSLLISTIACYVMSASATARRASPIKWQLLSLFTIGEAISVGFLTSFFKFHSVLTAMLTTALATTGISVYTIANRNAKYDLSQWGYSLAHVGLIFLFTGLLQLLEVVGVLPKGFVPISDKMYSCIGATLFSFYIAYHTKMIVAGKHTKYQMNEKDYVFGAMSLYNDIISMFIYILRIMGEDRDH